MVPRFTTSHDKHYYRSIDFKGLKPNSLVHDLSPILPVWHGSIDQSRYVEKNDFYIFAVLTTGFLSALFISWRGDGNRVLSCSRLDLILAKNVDLSPYNYVSLETPTSDHNIISLEVKSSQILSEKQVYSNIKEHMLDNPKFKENFMSKLILILKSHFQFFSLDNYSEKD